ncbi:MAG: M14 family metallopeptidase [Chloroherpetonaceae bacterium]|nr:M14 family metallopeptidase [Chloroherpetonaceae bacterium]
MNWKIYQLLRFVLIVYTVQSSPLLAQSEIPFAPNSVYDLKVPTPKSILGFELGSRPVRHSDVLKFFQVLANHSNRIQLRTHGYSHEGKELIYAIVTKPENLEKFNELQAQRTRLSDPRFITQAEANSIAEKIPALAWMAYTVHGDELSGTDASLLLAYHLTASHDSLTLQLLSELIICIEPIENPDGRDRFVNMVYQWEGQVPNWDTQSLNHTGTWPRGRHNHYLFDLNRDWLVAVNPETQARIRAIQELKPQLIIDAHEMGSDKTYFFNPPDEPINHAVGDLTRKWWKIFGSEQAKSFDAYGWSYFTRDTYDEWYPAYGSSYPLYFGAVGILYEQGSTQGSVVKRSDGTIHTFRESVHHQFVSSISNLKTAANNRKSLLLDFYTLRKQGGVSGRKDDPLVFYLIPDTTSTRFQRFMELLKLHQIEVRSAEKEFNFDAYDYWSGKKGSRRFPKGTRIIPLDQPMGRLAKVMMEFDPRMTTSFLTEERKSLEKKSDSKIYDVTGWSVPIAYGLETYWSSQKPAISTQPASLVEEKQRRVISPENPPFNSSYGYLIRYNDERSIRALSTLFEKGFKVRTSEKPFSIGGSFYGSGTLLIRKHENAPELLSSLKNIAEANGIEIIPTSTALVESGSDLGGDAFPILLLPRIAILTGPGIDPTSFAPLWHLLDVRFKQRVTLLSTTDFNRFDLARYNVLLLPSGNLSLALNGSGQKKLKEWTENGGTVIAMEASASYLADSSVGFTRTALRSQVSKRLSEYEKAILNEESTVTVDSLSLWSGKIELSSQKQSNKGDELPPDFENRAKLFMPRGTIMAVQVHSEHWLGFGADRKVGATIFTSDILVAKPPVEVAARFENAENLRLSGLLWPEARQAWARTAYLTRESKGKGQVILFAGEPAFRAYYHATEQLLLNAIYLGPGLGTRFNLGW